MKTQPRLTYLIRRAQLIVYTRLTECLREYTLTPMQYLLLSLSRHPGQMSSADLARRVAVSPQSMNEMITALQRKRLITRRRATEHRRILRIHLTPAGESLLRDCDLRVDSLEKSLFGILAPAEKASFRHLLTTFINSAEPGGAPEREWTEDPTRPAVAAGSRAQGSSTSKAPSSPPRTKSLAD